MNTHQFTVDFVRYVFEDQEIAEGFFPGLPLEEQLTRQLAYELDENPALVGTYTIESLTIVPDDEPESAEERFVVQFSYEHPGNKGHALQPFRAELQATYDRFGMAGSFQIRR